MNKAFDKLLYEDDLSNEYVKIIKSRVTQIFKFAIKNGYILESPIDKVEISYRRKDFTNIKESFLEDDEYRQLIEITKEKNMMYALLFQWLYLNGFRAGEAIGMYKDDVFLDSENEVFYAKVDGTLRLPR